MNSTLKWMVFAALLQIWTLPNSIANADDLPTVDVVLDAFRTRAEETRYVTYKATGTAEYVANSFAQSNPMTFEATGKFYPATDLKFEWIANADIDTQGRRGVYCDKHLTLSDDAVTVVPIHERTFTEGKMADIERLLPPEPEVPGQPPRPPIKFEINQERNFPSGGAFGIPAAVLAAFGHLRRDFFDFYPIADKNWALTTNASVTKNKVDESLIDLRFTDESSPGLVKLETLTCEGKAPFRLMQWTSGTLDQTATQSDFTYAGQTNQIESIRIRLYDVSSERLTVTGSLSFSEFAAESSVPHFSSKAQPREGDWVYDWASERAFQYRNPTQRGWSNWIYALLSIALLLMAAVFFRRSFGSAKSVS